MITKQILKLIYTTYNEVNFEKEAVIACNNICTKVVDSETKWRSKMLYMIVLDLDI